MIQPRSENFSHIVRVIRRTDARVEIIRWYSSPIWRSVSRTYRIKPHHANRLDALFNGLRASAH
jgi:hypothetical protein